MSLSMSEWPTYSTVRITSMTSDGVSTGTGFYVNFIINDNEVVPCLITNKHVVENEVNFLIYIKVNQIDETDETKNSMFEIRFPATEKLWVQHPDPDIDLAALSMAMFFNSCRHQGMKPVYAPFNPSMIATDDDYEDLTAIENILMVGYPIGLWDNVHNNPICRRGITATPVYNDFKGKKEFLIDCACFPGSSGSPVMLFDLGAYMNKKGEGILGASRLKILGVLYAGPQFTAQGELRIVDVPTAMVPMTVTSIPTNLGICIKATELSFFDRHFKAVVDAEMAARALDRT